ncbi:3'-5' exoribonuclease 1 isoform X3 [Catharus ustulatus]|uniref:3'-5' exoribonuclease 1 isoform X3 n=1 Tax=Catharus ustulatus TaxID=91951 RepID=UPI001407BB58|nr:3'-5' exoribonuclease 1 isoform X3 [Catharus ustulatus]
MPEGNAGSRSRSCSGLAEPHEGDGGGGAVAPPRGRLRALPPPTGHRPLLRFPAPPWRNRKTPASPPPGMRRRLFPQPARRQHCRISDQETNGKTSAASLNDFSDPIYKEIAITNGCINRMTREELRSKLEEFKLETRGVKDVLKKRLKNYYKKQKLMQKESTNGDSCYDYICVVDFEATCEEGNPPEFVHEIIEFPVVLVNTRTLEISFFPLTSTFQLFGACWLRGRPCSGWKAIYPIRYLMMANQEAHTGSGVAHSFLPAAGQVAGVAFGLQEDTFQQYVKPEINPKLSDFCISLTGITQDIVDKADIFPQVLQNAIEWMRQRELGTKYSYSVLTDGSWDMSKFLNIQCRISRIKYPSFAKKWINIRKSYGNFYKLSLRERNLCQVSKMTPSTFPRTTNKDLKVCAFSVQTTATEN